MFLDKPDDLPIAAHDGVNDLSGLFWVFECRVFASPADERHPRAGCDKLWAHDKGCKEPIELGKLHRPGRDAIRLKKLLQTL